MQSGRRQKKFCRFCFEGGTLDKRLKDDYNEHLIAILQKTCGMSEGEKESVSLKEGHVFGEMKEESMNDNGAFRTDIAEYVLEAYGTKEEQLWACFPDYGVLRHPNGKWYAILMDIEKSKLGLKGESKVQILVCKCEKCDQTLLLQREGFLPAYHMNRENWITLLLDGSIPKELATYMVDKSYQLTEQKSKKRISK